MDMDMDAERVTGALSRHVEAGAVPGLVVAHGRGAETVVEALGDLSRDAIVRITSLTKPVVAAATLLLVQDGVLRLDDPVDDLLPELADRQVLRDPAGPLDDTEPARRPITARDLLTFTWGFGMDVELPPTAPVQRAIAELELGVGPPVPPVPHSPDEWLRRLGSLPLMRRPGEKWIYHSGSDVLGVLLARASGTDLESVLRERVLAPLGMRDTGFAVPPAQRHRLPPLHADDGTVLDPPDGCWSAPPAFPSGAGGLVSTAADLLAFTRGLLGDLLSPESRALMVTEQLRPEQKGSVFLGDRGWSLGLSVYGDRIGWAGGSGVSWFAEPARGTTALLLTQRMFGAGSAALVEDFESAAAVALGD